MRRKIFTAILTLAIVGTGLGLGLLWGMRPVKPQDRIINVEARQYAYDPPVIRVNRGDNITIHLTTKDVTHGFYLEGYDIDAIAKPKGILYLKFSWTDEEGKEHEEYDRVDEINFVANKIGKFRYRCSQTCGSMHPFMLGELVVQNNLPYTGAIGLSIGLAAATLIFIGRKEEKK